MSTKFNNYYVLIIVLGHYYIVDQPIDHLQRDVKPMRVGEQVFHVSKNLLELVSLYFSRMPNNPNFVEANQFSAQYILDTGEIDAALFQDFPQNVISIPSIKIKLPDSQNLVGLMRLAHCYGMDSLFEKLEHSLKLFCDVPISERVLLAKKYGGKEFNVGGIFSEMMDLEEFRSISMALFKEE